MTKRKKSLLVLALCGTAGLLIFALVQFFFNPLGLGPEPEAVLPPSFFTHAATDLNSLELLIDGREAFDNILSAIDSAEKSIYIQTFIWKDDDTGREMTQHLKAAADRGVQVVVRKDIVGTVFEIGDFIDGKPSPVFTRAGLKNYPNIDLELELFADTDHSKYFIIDKRRVTLGGMNIADEYHNQWHDYMVTIDDAARTQAFIAKVLQGERWQAQSPFFIAVNDRHATEIRTALVQVIDHATESIILEHAYFSDDRIIAALVRAAQRGVEVSLILPETPDTHVYANRVTSNRLLRSAGKENIRIYLYPRMSHAKVVMADGNIAGVGSANLTPRSMRTSREIVLFVHGDNGTPFIEKLRAQLSADQAASRWVTEPVHLDFNEKLKALIGKYVW